MTDRRFLRFYYAAIKRYGDKPYIVELSNGTKFLCFFHNFGDALDDEILSAHGEAANTYVGDECVKKVAKNINKLNQY